jgi:hypothetical protein
MVTETQAVQQPRTVATWKPYESTRCVPRTVVMRVPLDPCYSSIPSTTTYYYPPAAAPPAPPATITRRVETEPEPEPELADPSDEDAVESVLKEDQDAGASTESDTKGSESESPPKDTDETGQPILDLQSLEVDPPGPINVDVDDAVSGPSA